MDNENEEVYTGRELVKDTLYSNDTTIGGSTYTNIYFTRIEHFNVYFTDPDPRTSEAPNVHYVNCYNYVDYSTSRERANFYFICKDVEHIFSDHYWLEERNNRLYLKCYYGKPVDDVMIKESINVHQNELVNLTDDLIFIEGGPGEGKTTLLINLTKDLKINNKQIVILCFLRNFTDIFDFFNFGNIEDVNSFLNYVVRFEEDNQCQERLFFNEDRITIILDGLDEICLDHRIKIEKLIDTVLEKYSNKTIIISSRHGVDLKAKYEKYRLKPWTKEEQIQYLQMNLKNEQKVKAILDDLDSVNSYERTILGIPLQLHMAVKIYQHEIHKKLSFLNYYEQMIKNPKMRQNIFQAVNKHILAKDFVNKTFILSNIKRGKPFLDDFDVGPSGGIYNTVIQFIIAKYFAENWRMNSNFIRDHFQSEEYKIVSYFFDLLMVQNKPLLNAVVRNNFEEVKEKLECMTAIDEAERNAFHFAAKYNRYDVLEILLKDGMEELVVEKDILLEKTAAQYATSYDRTYWLVIEKLCKYNVKVDVLELKMKINNEIEFEECFKTCFLEDNVKLFQLIFNNSQRHNSCDHSFIHNKLLTIRRFKSIWFSCIGVACFFGSFSLMQFLYKTNPYELCHPLNWSVVGHQNKCAEWLLSQGANIRYIIRGENVIHACARADNYEFIQKYLSEVKDYMFKGDKKGRTPIHAATLSASSKVLKILLDSSTPEELADVINKADGVELPVLHCAAKAGHLHNMKMLLSVTGVDVNVKDKYGTSLLLYSVMHSTPEMVQMVLEHGADTDTSDSLFRTSLMLHKTETAKFLMKQTNIVFINSKHGLDENSLLHEALKSHNLVNSSEFLTSLPNFDINVKNKQNATALMFAALYCTPEIIELLVKRGVDLNETDNQGRTVLHYALLANKPKNLQYLLSLPSIHLNSKSNKNLASYAAAYNTPQILKILLDHGVNISYVNDVGETVLMVALKANKTDNAKLLIATPGVDVHATNNNGMSVLMYAADGYTTKEILAILVDRGAGINEVDQDGNGALYHTIKTHPSTNDEEVCNRLKYLLSLSVDLSLKNKKHRTILMEAAFLLKPKYVVLLLEHGADITEDLDIDGQTIFHLPFQNKSGYQREYIPVIKILMSYCNGDIHMRNCKGQTMLEFVSEPTLHDALFNIVDDGLTELDSYETVLFHNAVREGDFMLVEYMLSNGADVLEKSSLHVTLLHQAVLHYGNDTLKVIIDEITKKCGQNAEKLSQCLNAKDSLGNTPFLWAAAYGRSYMADILIKNVLVDSNVTNNMGETALHLAARGGYLDKPFKTSKISKWNSYTINFLLNHGVDKTIVDKKGRTALDVAKNTLINHPGDTILQNIIAILEKKPPDDDDDLGFELFD